MQVNQQIQNFRCFQPVDDIPPYEQKKETNDATL